MLTVSDKDIIDAYKDHSVKELAQKFKRSTKTILRILKENNIILRPAHRRINIPTSEIISLYNFGLSQSQVGKIVGLSRDAVGNRLRKINFPLRDKATAKAIEYTDEEFKAFFLRKQDGLIA